MDSANQNHRLADLFVLCVLTLIVAGYLYDAYSASSHILNLILILPVGTLILVLCVVEFFTQMKAGAAGTKDVEEPEPVVTVLPVIGLFTAYVVSLNWLGFDVGTALFVAVFLWLHGERRIQWALGYGIAFGFLVALFFSVMLPYPMPMLILPTEY